MTKPSEKSTIRFTIFALILLVCWMLSKKVGFSEDQIKDTVTQFPLAISGAVYVVLYVVLTFFIWLSKDVLMVAGAWLYGLWGSTLLTYIAESLNAVVLFLLARKLGRNFVNEKLTGKWKNLDQRLSQATTLDLFLLRAVIFVPFRFLDLAFGLTNISFKKYMTAVLIASPIRVLMRQYFLVYIIQIAYNFEALTVYLQDNTWISFVCMGYIVVWMILLVRLKRLVFG